jgi:hypothetical protein
MHMFLLTFERGKPSLPEMVTLGRMQTSPKMRLSSPQLEQPKKSRVIFETDCLSTERTGPASRTLFALAPRLARHSASTGFGLSAGALATGPVLRSYHLAAPLRRAASMSRRCFARWGSNSRTGAGLRVVRGTTDGSQRPGRARNSAPPALSLTTPSTCAKSAITNPEQRPGSSTSRR